MNSAIEVITGLLLLLITFFSGFGLHRAGRPRQTGPLTLHKLIALGAVILIMLFVRQLGSAANMGGLLVGVTLLTGALYVGAIASGGWLSITRPAPVAVTAVHLIAPPLAVLLTVVTVYLLMSG